MFLAIKEKRFAKRIIKRLLESHSAVSAEKPNLSGRALYREVLLHSQEIDLAHVDRILQQAEDSVDEWTAHAGEGLGFRQVAHFFVVSKYREAGHAAAVVSYRDIVYSMIPAGL